MTKTQKKIQFSDEVRVRPVKHVHDMKPDTVSKIYYNKDDYSAFKNECYETATTLLARNTTSNSSSSSTEKDNNTSTAKTSSSTSSSSNMLCSRGIETFLSKKFALLRKERIENAKSVVFEEQRDQKEDGVCSEEFLAELYEDVSSKCQQEAYQRALQDRQDVLSYYDATATTSPSSPASSEGSDDDVSHHHTTARKFAPKKFMSSFKSAAATRPRSMMQMFTSPMA